MSRIVTNTNANTVYKNYSRNQDALSTSMERLSTGLRINRASDDPSGLAISETLRSQVKGTDAAVDVIANSSNFLNTVDGYLQTVHDMMGRMEELAVKMDDAVLTTSDKQNLANEFNALKSEVDNVFSSAKFNGSAIFGAARTLAVDANGNEFTVGTDSLAALAATSISTISATSAATSSLSEINAAIGTISTQRASIGADQSQLNYKSQALQNYSENASAAESRIRNADMAKESSMFARNQILVQASTAMLSQANQSSQNVLSLLK